MNIKRIIFIMLLILSYLTALHAEVLFEDSFESGNFNAWTEQGTAVIWDSDCHLGDYCAEYDFNRSYGIHYVKLETSFEAAYLSFWIKFDEDFKFGLDSPGGKHLVRFYDLDGISPVPQMDTGWDPDTNYSIIFFTRDGEDNFVYRFPNPFRPGVWQHYEIYFGFNDPGEANGFITFSVDGEDILKEEDIILRDGINESVEFDTLAFTNYDNGYYPGEYPRYWVDDVLLATTPVSDDISDDGTGTSGGGGCGIIRSSKRSEPFLVTMLIILIISGYMSIRCKTH